MSVAEDGSKYLDYTNDDILTMANPSVGQSVRLSDLQSDAWQAFYDPQQRKDFFNKSLNVFTNSVDAYFDMGKVTNSNDHYHWTIDELAKLPIKWYGGADLSKLHDLTGVSLYGRYQGVDIAITHAFCPVMEANRKNEEDNIPTAYWQEMDWLTVCNSDVIEYSDVVKWFKVMKEKGFQIQWVGYDQRYSRDFIQSMKMAGFKVVNQKQWHTEKTEAFREIEKKIISGSFYYVSNRAVDYCIENVKAVEDAEEFVKYSKVMPNQRIDLFDATVIACKQMMDGGARSKSMNTFFG